MTNPNTETLTAEIWIDPVGRPAELRYVGLTTFDGDDPWYAESPGQRHPRTYEMRQVGGTGRKQFVVSPVDPWSPYDAISDRLVSEGWTAPAPTAEELAVCEHGLSAQLCAGPSHYPLDAEGGW